MQIEFNHILPHPLREYPHGANSIWGNHIVIPSGKKVMLNASSGKGKTTFTHLLYGLRKDYDGTLRIAGKDTRDFTPDDWTTFRQTQMSIVFQDLQLFPDLSVKENLQLKNNLTQTYSEDELKAMLDRLEIGDKWEQRLGLLSMGQQQRVAIIRALCQPFEMLIMDEPFSHLDEANTQRCLKLINERCDAIQAGFVLTTLGDDHQFNYDITLNL